MAKKTHEAFLKEVNTLGKNFFVVLGRYQSNSIEVKVKHLLCGREWDAVPSTLLMGLKRGGGCVDCSRIAKCEARRKTPEEFRLEVFNLVGEEYTFLDDYEKAAIRIRVRHNKCGEVYAITPNKFLCGDRCNKCANELNGIRQRKEENTFKQEVFELVGNEYTVLGDYQTSQIKIKIRHNKCQHTYEVKPNNFLQGKRCPDCHKISKGEVRIAKFLKKKKIKFKREKTFSECRAINVLPFDFYINDNLLIEYDGEFHFEPARYSKNKQKMLDKLKSQQQNDRIKNQYCIDNGIYISRIPFWELDSIEDILESVLIKYGLEECSTKVNYESKYSKYIVDANWNHDDYIASNPKNKEAV